MDNVSIRRRSSFSDYLYLVSSKVSFVSKRDSLYK
jgi:hypothetical protein